MKIVTDCAADLSAKEREELGIVEAPLYIQFPEGEVSAADLTPDEFYNRLEAMRPDFPTTAQPSSGVFADIYRKLAETSKQMILSIHISSGLSGTINSARVGSKQVEGSTVQTIDTMTLSGGQRFQVLAAAWAAKIGWSVEAITERLAQIREKTEVIYTLETLEYLARGGRIGRVQALAGSMLKIKPIIRVDHADGRYSTVGKGRTIKRNLAMIVDHLAEMYGSIPLWVTVLHGRFAESAEMLAESVQERLNVGKLEIARISPVLGVHTGPGIVGAAVMPMELVEDLL
ncbi:MAG: DegV family protein [Chloroflexi bacterium]|nr:DegV family protein [Chloroflexota bacterium]